MRPPGATGGGAERQDWEQHPRGPRGMKPHKWGT